MLFNNNILQSQNLVPNWSFEDLDSRKCPYQHDQIEFAAGWSKYSNGDPGWNTTPDYFNSCANPGFCGVPYTGMGFRPARRNCDAFAGLVTIQPAMPYYREHIGIQLKQSLVIGEKYYISFYIAADLQKIAGKYYGMWSNNIGIKLSTVAYSGNNPITIDNYAHLNSSTIIQDTINWHLISGSFIADSAYKYLIIGNFFDNEHTDTLPYNCNICYNSYSHYFIDDICLSTDSLLCNGGLDSMQCDNVAVNKNSITNKITIFPNPAKDLINISLKEKLDAEIIIYNFLGNAIFMDKIANKNIMTINLSSLTEGYYLIKIINKNNNTIINKKFFKL